jgi:cytosine/adenosine deaminase-related metal-dependent hydrolase
MSLGGATALGRDDLGRLAPGAKADITIVDLSALRTGPIDDPIRMLCMYCHGDCVRDVIVAGRHVVQNRAIPGVDIPQLRAAANAYFARYKQAYAAWDVRHGTPNDLFPSSFRTIAPPHRR